MNYISVKQKNTPLFTLFAILAILLGSFLFPFISRESVAAFTAPSMTIRDDAYSALYVGQSLPDPIVFMEGETKTVILKFKNTGTATWNASGVRYVSAFTIEPKYRSSLFKGASWKGSDQTAAITKTVKPGEIAEIPVELKAGKAGTYKEQFYLAANNYTWIKGGFFYLDLRVEPAKVVVNSPTPSPASVIPTKDRELVGTYTGEKVILSKKEVVVKPGEKVKVRAHFRNTGTTTWSSYALRATTVGYETVTFAGTDWTDTKTTKMITQNVAPTYIAENTFFLIAPTKEGRYTLRLQLEADHTAVTGAVVEIPITISGSLENAPNKKPSVEKSVVLPRLNAEPALKIGLWEAPETVEFWTPEDDYRIFDGDTEVGIIPKQVVATVSHTTKLITISYQGTRLTTDGVFRLVPSTNSRAVFELKNFTRTVSWKKNTNYNKYRGTVILQFGKKDKQFWVINETLLEDYVAGIAETGNSTHPEYQKALLTAARTYAYYLKTCACKYGSFDVVPNTADQLFLGYNSELEMPNISKAAKDTRGMMMTYDVDQNPATLSEIVITPYFSNTDGRTRSWSEVWGGKAKPWLVSVEATYDKRDGKKMWGHGVGMSNRDAIIRAEEGGASWEEILQYYYSGIEVERIYY